MTTKTTANVPHSTWPESVNLSSQLFFEADQLSEAAYALLNHQPVTTQSLHEFSELKRRADNKYIEARRKWLDTKDEINR
ncbi:hypothetical protein [Pseudomonas fluorescens]|uniref:Uncharacterized protein n=1 Tax=Pseudomonas fluorescens TaxID=294 RepID=A0A5E7EYR4_PSEFL|nr:hypothetical protein [Pseudomonas fluorescens]VVO31999.1 hypothetical protein PS723_05068 [Pseudomonas fluorescens]